MKLKKTHINFTRRGSFIWRTVPVCLFLSCTAGSSWPGTCSATTFLVFYLTFKDLSSCRTVYFFAKSRSFKDYTFDLYILMHTCQLNLPVLRNVIFRLGGGGSSPPPLTCFGNNSKSIGLRLLKLFDFLTNKFRVKAVLLFLLFESSWHIAWMPDFTFTWLNLY